MVFYMEWKYLFGWCRDLQVHKENGKELETGPEPVERFFSNVGEQGWEYCGSLPEGDGVKLIFKKPLKP